MAHNNKQPGSRRDNAQLIQARNNRQRRGEISSCGIENAQMQGKGMRRASGASQRPSSLAWVSSVFCPYILMLLIWPTISNALGVRSTMLTCPLQCLVKHSDIYCRRPHLLLCTGGQSRNV